MSPRRTAFAAEPPRSPSPFHSPRARPRWPRTTLTMAPTSRFSLPGIRRWSTACGKDWPGRAGFAATIVPASVFDAVNGVTGRYTPYFETQRAPAHTSAGAAAIGAAHEALTLLFPSQQATYDALLTQTVAQLPQRHRAAVDRGLAWGTKVADDISAAHHRRIQHRASDLHTHPHPRPLAAHPAAVRTSGKPPGRDHGAVHHELSRPVPATAAARAHQRPLHARHPAATR